MMRIWNLLLCAILTVFTVRFGMAQVSPQNPIAVELTLQKAIEIALQNNIDLALASHDLEMFHSQYKQAIGVAIGDIRGVASYTRNFKNQAIFFSQKDPTTGTSLGPQKIKMGADNQFSAGLSFEQPLFTGGRVSAGIRAGKKRIEAGQQAFRAVRQEVVFATKQFFYAYLLAKANVAIQKDNLKLAQEHLNTIQARYKQGLDSDLVILRQKVEVANANTTLIQAQNFEDLSITNLQKVLYLDMDKTLELSGELLHPDSEIVAYSVALEKALKKNPVLEGAKNSTQVAMDYYQIVRADNWPDIKGFADYSWLAQSDDFSVGSNERNDSLSAGIKMEFRIFTGGEIKERIAQALIEVDRAKEREIKIEREIRVQVKQSWLGMKEADERVRSQEAAIEQARRALEVTETRYKMGQASQLEQNDATFVWHRSRTIYVQALHDYGVAQAALEKTIGEE